MPNPLCGACRSDRVSRVCDSTLYIPGGTLPDTIWKCIHCGTFFRGVNYDDPSVRAHFDVTSYTVPETESRARASRIGFFARIIRLASKHGPVRQRATRVLDVGAAYGYLLDLYRQQGAECAGIEIVDWLRNRLHEKGCDAFKTAAEIPDGTACDVITVIDSLYYVEQPAGLLRELRPHLAPDGTLIIRIANRTPVFNLLRLFHRPIPCDLFGDVKYNFSFGGIQHLLTDTGYQIERVVLNEKGKKTAIVKTRLYYKLSLVASHLTGLILTPGIILVCRSSGSAV